MSITCSAPMVALDSVHAGTPDTEHQKGMKDIDYKSEDHEDQLLAWAQNYNAYERIADDWVQVNRMLMPLREEWEAHQRIADWAGVDLLRAWAFYCAREACNDMYKSLLEGYPQVEAIADAIRAHPAARPRDMPPDNPWDRPSASGFDAL